MVMKRLLALLGGTLLSTFLLIGCGTNNNNNTPPPPDTNKSVPDQDMNNNGVLDQHEHNTNDTKKDKNK